LAKFRRGAPARALTWINRQMAELADFIFMTTRPGPPIRACPLCGVAMQASKSQDYLPHFDTFECMTCRTVISLSKRSPPVPDRGTDC
jgi:hypothetical protein